MAFDTLKQKLFDQDEHINQLFIRTAKQLSISWVQQGTEQLREQLPYFTWLT